MSVTFPETSDGEALTVSATAFLTWRRCPDRALARFQGEYDKATIVAFRGIVAHRVFARHLTSGPIADEELRQVCREEIGKGLNASLVELGLKPTRIDAVVEEVRALYTSFSRLPIDGVREVELQIDEDVGGGVRLRGVIDAVFDDRDGTARLTDWKTGSIGEAATQLAFYALLWRLSRATIPALVEAISVSSGERIEAVPTEESLQAMAVEIAGMVTDVRRALHTGGRLDRVAGPWCASCPLLEGCGEGAAAMAVLRN